jgi:type VI secretion system protein
MKVGLLEGILGRFRSGKLVPEYPASMISYGQGNATLEYGSRFDSIKEHLVALLNTRSGSLPHLPDYGLPDSTKVSMKDMYSVSDFGKEIEETVKKYEPRLTQVRVKPLEREPGSIADFRLGFLLEARVVDEDTRFHAFFRTSGSAVVEDAKE